ncbi:cyclic pyranopterin monophosphate synthase MoaC [Mucilaginibacter sp. RS28]|uniref:cyclic pyranopterin monophosphate synthase n=1 Tax=Mucilaginibacter straminoryzae TaxID=2932774 RepID=A0A9X1X0N7_9SPHI|nr:cyclic pyranopterin monophosphate synthase MoaC [Mucilaginibacter straminoryzae]MCJ8209077.1 cyclic pyranopterin monophosphate synthase MoaC [Mucilaginibacter straminoryzae]
MKNFSHIDDDSNQPRMVDVSDKAVTRRTAIATAIISLGKQVMLGLKQGELHTKKGPVFQTAIIAGTMAVKKTAELIPFCHPLPTEAIKITIDTNDAFEAVVTCEVTVTGKTGVEMEALTGASVAALTIYDMCKAVSQEMVIRETKLIKKTGGKSDYTAG